MVYHQNVIYTTCGATVLLKFVESMTFDKNPEDMVINKLMDDFCYNIRTVSGQEYRISVKYIADTIGEVNSIQNIAQAIFDKWKHIHRET